MQGFTETLLNWDQSYYAQKQQAALFNLTDEDVRPYFAYPTVLAGLHEVSLTLQPDILSFCFGQIGCLQVCRQVRACRLTYLHNLIAADGQALQCHHRGC